MESKDGKQPLKINCQGVFERLSRLTWEDIEIFHPEEEGEMNFLLGLLLNYMEKDEVYRLIDSCVEALDEATARSFIARFEGRDSSDPLVVREIQHFEATWSVGRRAATRSAFYLIITFVAKLEAPYPLDPNADLVLGAGAAA